MSRPITVLGCLTLLGQMHCNCESAEAGKASTTRILAHQRQGDTHAKPSNKVRMDPEEARIKREYPLYGVVQGVHLAIRSAPNPEADALGWVRAGSQLRLKARSVSGQKCRSGWHRVHPEGWVCVGQGVSVDDKPKNAALLTAGVKRDTPLPYNYFFVKEVLVPEYHRLPSRNEQRAARAVVNHYRSLLQKEDEGQSARDFLTGLSDPATTTEPKSPAVVRRYLERQFYVAGTGVETRAFRNFVRTVWGSYVKESALIQRQGSNFHGVTLDDNHQLPLAFARRAGTLMKLQNGERPRFHADSDAPAIARYAIIPGWQERKRIGLHNMHVFASEGEGERRYLKEWFAGIARKQPKPLGIGAKEPWIHVDLSEQVLVMYQGSKPIFATLVSTGLPEHDTPTGLFTIRKKFITDTMAALGPDAGDDRYRIDDVPWTQYISGSIALHGAFWHDRFGLKRSHGCINLAPQDAQTIFRHTLPRVPHDWHGITGDRKGITSSHVLITS